MTPAEPVNVVWRETWRRRVWRAIACRLVDERDDGLLVLWHPDGTPAEIPVDDTGRKLRIPGEADWTLRRELSVGQSLGLVRLGSRWSLWHEWRRAVLPLVRRSGRQRLSRRGRRARAGGKGARGSTVADRLGGLGCGSSVGDAEPARRLGRGLNEMRPGEIIELREPALEGRGRPRRDAALSVSTAEDAAAIRAEGEHVIAAHPWPSGWEEWHPDPLWA